MKKYRVIIREYSYETEAENEDMAKQTAEDINWNRVEVVEIIDNPSEDIDKVEIYFDDLSEETQGALLKLYGIREPGEMNWDTIPITIIEKPE